MRRDTRYLVSEITNSDLTMEGIAIASCVVGLHPNHLDPIFTKIPGRGISLEWPGIYPIVIITDPTNRTRINLHTYKTIYWATDSINMKDLIQKINEEGRLFLAKEGSTSL